MGDLPVIETQHVEGGPLAGEGNGTRGGQGDGGIGRHDIPQFLAEFVPIADAIFTPWFDKTEWSIQGYIGMSKIMAEYSQRLRQKNQGQNGRKNGPAGERWRDSSEIPAHPDRQENQDRNSGLKEAVLFHVVPTGAEDKYPHTTDQA